MASFKGLKLGSKDSDSHRCCWFLIWLLILSDCSLVSDCDLKLMPEFQAMILLELYSHFLEVEVTGVFRWVSGRGRGYGGRPLFIYYVLLVRV